MTNEESRRILIPLDFLGNRDKGYKATIYQDQNGEIRIERIKIDNNKKRFETKLESGGGFVMSIEKE
jgi:Glycoside hydrolase 97.